MKVETSFQTVTPYTKWLEEDKTHSRKIVSDFFFNRFKTNDWTSFTNDEFVSLQKALPKKFKVVSPSLERVKNFALEVFLHRSVLGWHQTIETSIREAKYFFNIDADTAPFFIKNINPVPPTKQRQLPFLPKETWMEICSYITYWLDQHNARLSCYEFSLFIDKDNLASPLTIHFENFFCLNKEKHTSYRFENVVALHLTNGPYCLSETTALDAVNNLYSIILPSSQLRELHLCNVHWIKDQDLQILEKITHPKLTLLELSNCSKLTQKTLIYLKNLNSLKELNLNSYPNLYDLSPLSSLTSLKNLNINDITHTGMKVNSFHVISKLPNLRSLSMKGVEVSVHVLALLKNSSSLKRIWLSPRGEYNDFFKSLPSSTKVFDTTTSGTPIKKWLDDFYNHERYIFLSDFSVMLEFETTMNLFQ